MAKSICTNVNTAGNLKIEDVDLKFEQKLISEHPEIKVPSDMVIDKQFYFVINKLMVKTIMENKNVNEIEAEQILKANPEIEKFIKPYNPSIIRQN